MNELSGKVAIISGGTSGIGRATALKLESMGATVIILGRNDVYAKVFVDKESKIDYYHCDVTNDEDVKKTIGLVVEKYKHIDILFNNAGIYPSFTNLLESDIADWEIVFSTNVFGLASLTKYCLPHLIKCRGTIINNASIAGLQHFASGQGYAYASSKAAVIQFTRMIAKKYAKEIRVNCICPGVIDTPLYYNLDKEVFSERIPSGIIGMPDDVANVVAFLVSDSAKYIYGAVIPIDGGLTL